MTSAREALPLGADDAGFAGHPRGFAPLFFTELWERFSYYGMRAILVLYMVAPAAQGGLGFDTKKAASIYGTYTMAVYLTAIPGGLLADRLLGLRLAVLVGGIVIAAGHFSMVFGSMVSFYGGMALIAVGTGLLKPNINGLVGSLYGENDPRRDSGFSLFYMGINIGAVLAPLVCGYMAQGAGFKSLVARWGYEPSTSWHWAFGAAGVGMTLGIVIYLANRRRIAHVGNRPATRDRLAAARPAEPLTPSDWRRIGAIFVFFVFTILFWAAYEQKGASLNLFALHLVRNEIGGLRFPSSWLQSLTPFFVILLAPIFSVLWVRMGRRQPSSPLKFTLGLSFIGLAYVLLVPGAALTAQGRISPLWLVGLYFLEVVGEMCLSPVGLSTVSKLAPARLLGIMMGVWFLAAALGNKLAGFLSGFFVANDAGTLVRLYGGIAAGLLLSAALLFVLRRKVEAMMSGVR